MLKDGDIAPDFALPDEEGNIKQLSTLKGRYKVVYFYPKDDTPGCTTEAGQFRDAYRAFAKKGARIVGVSRDSVASHKKFKEKYDIPFPLLADVDSKLSDAFGVIVEKNMYGKKSVGIQRSTFLFDASGKLVHVWPKVTVNGHAEEVLSKL